MQNLGRFYATSDFDRECLRNDARYPKSESQLIETVPPAFGETSPVNFCSLTRKFGMWVWTHPNRLFLETIFRPIGGAGPEIFIRARHWPRLASAHHKQGRENFKGEHLKLGL